MRRRSVGPEYTLDSFYCLNPTTTATASSSSSAAAAAAATASQSLEAVEDEDLGG